MRQVHFMDTTILCCLLNVPNFCEDGHMEVVEEFARIVSRNEVVILPIASIIETGNHIA